VTGKITYAPFHDSFDAGTLNFPDTWNVDTSVAGQITLHRPEPWLNSGAMEVTGSASSGHGYGTYTVRAMMTGNVPGPAIMLWPGDNKWPGSEIDFGEISGDGSGQQYSSLHWADGGDNYDVRFYDPSIKTGVWHDYQVVWEPGRLTMSVDGKQQAVYTEHVPADYAHGGMDHVFAFLNISPYTTLTVTDARYDPLGTTAAAVAPQAAEQPVDWDALAAQVMANYEATGTWFI
jgi:beta-glucanase (GH16 family)